MRGIFWLAVFGFVLAAGGLVWYSARRFKERQAGEEERLAAFLAVSGVKPKAAEAAPVVTEAADGLSQQKLLFEAAHRAGQAGERALAIQLYARLLARYPASSFAGQARAAAEAEKKKLAKA